MKSIVADEKPLFDLYKGIVYYDGNMFATDGHIFFSVKTKYPEIFESKIVIPGKQLKPSPTKQEELDLIKRRLVEYRQNIIHSDKIELSDLIEALESNTEEKNVQIPQLSYMEAEVVGKFYTREYLTKFVNIIQDVNLDVTIHHSRLFKTPEYIVDVLMVDTEDYTLILAPKIIQNTNVQ